MSHVHFILPYGFEGASTRFRVEQYLDRLEEAGFTYALSFLLDDEAFRILQTPGRRGEKAGIILRGLRRRMRDLREARDADILFLHREAFPVGPPLFERRFAKRGPRLVYDFDDAIYLPKERPFYPALGWLRNPGKIGEVISLADRVIAGNEVLAGYARPRNPAVEILPTPVDAELFSPGPLRGEGDVPVLGWIGSPTGIPYLDPLRPVLRDLARRFPFRVRVVGGYWECPGVPVESVPWQRTTEVEEIRGMDIGLMPLPDTPWTRGKCSFKLIQYMSCGKAAIASPVGMNREVVEHGSNALLAGSEGEWREGLSHLLGDREHRSEMGEAGRRTVLERYSVSALGPRLVEILNDVITRR